jgi:hypothetical protein
MAQGSSAPTTAELRGIASAEHLALRPPRTERLGEFWHALRRNPTALFGVFLVGISGLTYGSRFPPSSFRSSSAH